MLTFDPLGWENAHAHSCQVCVKGLMEVKVDLLLLVKARTPCISCCSVQVTLLFFAKSRELSGVSETSASLPSPVTGAQLWDHILSLYPRSHPLPQVPLSTPGPDFPTLLS